MDIWAVLHYRSIIRGGEWIETRLLSSGPRTHPWFRECSSRILQPNESIAFDTDLIGPYGMCRDISRAWWIGDDEPPVEFSDTTRRAHDHPMHNMGLVRPGLLFSDLTHALHQVPDDYQHLKYGCAIHDVGLCDERPLIAYPDQFVEGAFQSVLEPGMLLCVKALVSPHQAHHSIKLEDQVLITETGYENLTHAPFDHHLQGL
jgi:Xaa-Pro dipeptidase